MKHLLAGVVYTALGLLANPALAGTDDIAALRDGAMKKLEFHSEMQPIPDGELLDEADRTHRLSDFRGEWLVVNFWATWCAPCRQEMPTLSALQTAFDGEPVRVVTIATGRNSVTGIAKFFEEIGVDNLPQLRDPNQALARQMAIFGLPITVIVDPEGNEVARLRGDADWNSDSAIAILQALAAGD
ncbi:TlpA disulfide reductase family protein [Tropicimonas sp. IMCC34043]|uniref:TlpA family protein disulfide reductase n=1 Tax=Tropicimonas sp. IMCC34043 TaxID=2248760 RepID=UPI000E246A47|nr:TlpA disulfide reductase family protein [Tropicimonas sp. IMCC34043]